MAAVEGLGVARQVGLAGVQQQVVVIAHEAVGPGLCVKALERLAHDVQKQRAVGIVLRDGLAPVAARSDVVHRAGVFDA